MKTAYIFHDAFNNPTADWYPWMKTTLEGMGYITYVPNFPTPGAQSYESWKATLKNYLRTFDTETIFIGHGVGGAFALRLVEELSQKIHGVFLVGSYAESIGHVGYDRLNETFVKHDFNWKKIKNNILVSAVFAGSDDPFVPLDITNRLATHLGDAPIIIPGGGHINKASGFTQATALAQGIKEQLTALDKSIVIEPIPQEIPIPEKKIPITEINDMPESQEKDTPIILQEDHPNEIQTMYKDMSQLVNSNQGRVASSLLEHAREDVVQKKEHSPLSRKNILYIIATGLVIIIGAGTVGYVLYQYLPAQQVPLVQKPPSLIPSETYVGIETSGKKFFELESLIRKALDEPLSENTLKDIVYTNNGFKVPFPELMKMLEINTLPPVLGEQFMKTSPSSAPILMHAVVKLGGKKDYFLVIPFNAYDALFNGMKDWEETLFRDVGLFMNVPNDFLRSYTTRGNFTSEMVNNRDIRVLRYTTPVPTLEDQPTQLESFIAGITSATASLGTPTSSESSLSGFTSGEATTLVKNVPEPVIQKPAPYRAGDLMVAYFFLNQKTLVIVNDLNVIPDIIKRWANRQVFD